MTFEKLSRTYLFTVYGYCRSLRKMGCNHKLFPSYIEMHSWCYHRAKAELHFYPSTEARDAALKTGTI